MINTYASPKLTDLGSVVTTTKVSTAGTFESGTSGPKNAQSTHSGGETANDTLGES